MDVAILGTGESARRFAGTFLFDEPSGRTDEPFDRQSTASSPDDTARVDDTEYRTAVTLFGGDATAVMDAVDALEDGLRERSDSTGAHLERVDGTTDSETAVGEASLVIETRSDDLETVRRRLAGVEERLDDETVLAVASAVAPATAAAAALERPGRAIGLSLVSPDAPAQAGFDPGDASGVVEVVRADQTDDTTVETVSGYFDRRGSTPVVVNDAPGRLSGRFQLALEVEAMRAVEADVATPAAIDAVLEDGFDHVEGPLASADRTGLDTRLEQLETLATALGPRFEPPAVLESKVESGHLGMKTGSGFREWDGDQPVDRRDAPGT